MPDPGVFKFPVTRVPRHVATTLQPNAPQMYSNSAPIFRVEDDHSANTMPYSAAGADPGFRRTFFYRDFQRVLDLSDDSSKRYPLR